MTTQSSFLTRRISWTKEPCGLHDRTESRLTQVKENMRDQDEHKWTDFPFKNGSHKTKKEILILSLRIFFSYYLW